MLISEALRGRVDVVPNCCHIATEFVCVWLIPVLPRRSFLVYKQTSAAEQSARLPVPLSGKSVLTAYTRALLWVWIFACASALAELACGDRPKEAFAAATTFGGFIGLGALLLLALGRLSRASYRRREQLASINGLPSRIVARLLEERFEILEHPPPGPDSERGTVDASASRGRAASPPLDRQATPTEERRVSLLRRASAWFLDGGVVVFLTVFSLVLLFGLAEQFAGARRGILKSIDALALLLPPIICLLYNTTLTASPLRATVGKRVLGLAVTDLRGKPLRMRTALLRELVKYPCFLVQGRFPGLTIGGVSLHDPIVDRWLHDRIAGTQVVRRSRRQAVPARRNGTMQKS